MTVKRLSTQYPRFKKNIYTKSFGLGEGQTDDWFTYKGGRSLRIKMEECFSFIFKYGNWYASGIQHRTTSIHHFHTRSINQTGSTIKIKLIYTIAMLENVLFLNRKLFKTHI